MVELVKHNPFAILALILLNVLLSIWALYSDPVINNDGVLYVSIANLMLDGNWHTALDSYNWPFYSILIAAVAKLLSIDAESAAYLTNTALIILLTFGFTNIVGELSNYNRRIMMIALIVVILFPSITKYRAFIIRDFGYLACYLWSLYYLIKFCKLPSKSSLIAWLLLTLSACLFRFEGVAFVLVAPYLLLYFSGQQLSHRRRLLSAAAVLILVSVVGLLSWYLQQKYTDSITVANLAGKDISGLVDLFLHNLSHRYGEDIMTAAGLTKVLAGTTGDVIYELTRRLAGVYLVFAAYAWFKGIALKTQAQSRIWLIYLTTNLCLLIGFSLFNSFLVSRYVMATALTILLLAPFAINHLMEQWAVAKLGQKIITAFAFLIIGFASIEGLNVSTNKMHIREAGEWLANNLEQGTRLYSNSRLAIYYSGVESQLNLNEEYSNTRLNHYYQNDYIKQFDIIAIDVNPKSHTEVRFMQTFWFKFGRPATIINGEDGRAFFVFSTQTCPSGSDY